MKKMAILADDPTISFVLYSNWGCLFLTAVSPLSFVNFVKWTPQSVMSYFGTRLVSFSSILKRKSTATALRIVRLFPRWTRESCGRIRIVLHKINILMGKSISSTLLMYCQNDTHAFRRCLLQSHRYICMRMNQDSSLCMFHHFYMDVIYRGSLRKWNIMIGRVVVHYGWQISSRKLCG